MEDGPVTPPPCDARVWLPPVALPVGVPTPRSRPPSVAQRIESLETHDVGIKRKLEDVVETLMLLTKRVAVVEGTTSDHTKTLDSLMDVLRDVREDGHDVRDAPPPFVAPPPSRVLSPPPEATSAAAAQEDSVAAAEGSSDDEDEFAILPDANDVAASFS